MSELERYQGAPLALLKDQLAPGAPELDLAWFAHVAQHLELDPFAGQIVLIGRWNNAAGRTVYKPQITVDGRRAIAQRTGVEFAVDGPVWCGPRVRGELIWQDVWDDDETPPYCARVLIYAPPMSPRPKANGTAKWIEFAQWITPKSGKPYLSPQWEAMPSHMLGKVAEAMALRRAFPESVGAAVGYAEREPPELLQASIAPEKQAPGSPRSDESVPSSTDVAGDPPGRTQTDPGAARGARERSRALAQRLNELWRDCEVSGKGDEALRAAEVSAALGRPMAQGDTLSDADLELVIAHVERRKADGWKGF